MSFIAIYRRRICLLASKVNFSGHPELYHILYLSLVLYVNEAAPLLDS